jgi:hypothetical protein
MARHLKNVSKARRSTKPRPSTAYCSFCLKAAAEVQKLVAGHGRIFICDECIAACNDCIAHGTSNRSKPRSLNATTTESLLVVLKPIEETVEGKSNQLQAIVEVLRSRRVSWADIGQALVISRQSAWERFSHTSID